MFPVKIVWEVGNSSVSEVMAGLEGAIGQHLILPLSQNQQAITTCRHNLHTNMTIIIFITPINWVCFSFFVSDIKDRGKVESLVTITVSGNVYQAQK